jgi:tetratricopeptide (TPR) repeat protein
MTKRSPIRLAAFALAACAAFLAALELACRVVFPASWLRQEVSLYKNPRGVAVERMGRDAYVRALRDGEGEFVATYAPFLRGSGGTFALQERGATIPVSPPADPSRERRWYLLGSSAARGWTADPSVRIAPLLGRELGGVEVFNAANVASTSTGTLGIALRVLDYYAPRGLIVYEGNNEFIGWSVPRERRVAGFDVDRLAPLLCRSRVYEAMARLRRTWLTRAFAREGGADRWSSMREFGADDFCARFALDPPASFTRERWEETRALYLGQFARNLEILADEARARGVPLVLCTNPINPVLPPCYWLPQPASLVPALRPRLSALLRQGWGRFVARDLDGARAAFREATALDPESALAWQGLGMTLLRRGDLPEATRALRAARERVVGYLGSMDAVNARVRDVAAREGARACDLENLFVEESLRDGGPERDGLFLDYCHPSEKGNRLIARALAEVIRGL